MVYLLHFERALFHAQHYMGYADDIKKRVRIHRSGSGSRLVRVMKDHGIDDLCPICRSEKKKGGE